MPAVRCTDTNDIFLRCTADALMSLWFAEAFLVQITSPLLTLATCCKQARQAATICSKTTIKHPTSWDQLNYAAEYIIVLACSAVAVVL